MKIKKGDLIRYAGRSPSRHGPALPGKNIGIVLDVHYPHGSRSVPWVSVKWPTGNVSQPISIRGFEIVTGENEYG